MPKLRKLPPLLVLLLLVLAASLACTLPGLLKPTPTLSLPPPTATATAAPLPPALVESSPLAGSEIALDATLSLTFNQPMDRTSVEGALVGTPPLSGKINWTSDRLLTFTPDTPFLPGTELTLTVNPSARSLRGLTMIQPAVLTYHTAGPLRLAQKLPDPEAAEVAPDSAIVAAFNQPVVPLGADPVSLPAAFSLEPPVAGRGEWENTSTYIFYPEPGLAGGTKVTVRLNPELKSTQNSPLETAESWSFYVAAPRLLASTPQDVQSAVRLDSPVTLTFNQAMSPESVLASFSLLDATGQPVAGKASWNQPFTEFTYTPAALLQRDSLYTVRLNAEAQNTAGMPIGTVFSVTWQTVPALSITIDPDQKTTAYGILKLSISADLPDGDLTSFFTFKPALSDLTCFLDESRRVVHFLADFAAETTYTLQVSPDLTDAWGGKLGMPYTLSFTTAAFDPTLIFPKASGAMFLTPQDKTISAQVANLSSVQTSLGTLPLADFNTMFFGTGAFDLQEKYRSADERTWTTPLEVSPSRMQVVELPVSPSGEGLNPGLYFLHYDNDVSGFYGPFALVVSHINLTLKISGTEAFVWAVDLRTGEPVAGASLSIYISPGTILVSGQTNADGILQVPFPVQTWPHQIFIVVLGQPGEDQFGLTISYWLDEIEPDFFGIPLDIRLPGLMTYFYTDRPIYKPGQTVYFRAVARQAYNGVYSLPDQPTLPVTIYDGTGAVLSSSDLPLNAFGTAYGEYKLMEGAAPGYYRLQYGEDVRSNVVDFQVVDSRKTEIDLNVSLAAVQVQLGQSLAATVSARYFFDAPAGNIPLQWAVYRTPAGFSLPGYQVGVERDSWLEDFSSPAEVGPLGNLVAEGQGMTGPQGRFNLEVPTMAEVGETPGLQRYTLEVTLQDESGLPVSARATALVHPAAYYIGLRPDAWVGQVGSEMGFEVLAADWDQNPVGVHALRAEFRKVKWVQQEAEQVGGYPTIILESTSISSADFATDADGLARLSFTPPEPGTYQLAVDGGGGGATTQVTLWVGGVGQAAWPQLPNQHLPLTAKDSGPYLVGQTAQVFIPNPFGVEVPALVTVERATVLRYQVMRLNPQGTTLPIPITDPDVPTIHLSVLLLGANPSSQPDFRLGYLTLNVAPVQNILNVEVTSQPERMRPGNEVTFAVRVTDSGGKPVQGEFSLSVVDEALLALADPNAPQITEAFYGEQPIGVYTSLDLAAYVNRSFFPVYGTGGGEGIEPPLARSDFPDTAYWNAEIVTDANGAAAVSMRLPDSLTTWRVQVRGLTTDTRVGESETQVIATKELLVRPALPRFLVAGDHTLLAAVLQNNTSADLQVEAALQVSGFLLDESNGTTNTAARQVSLPAGGRQRVEWWGTVQDVSSLDVTFSTRAGDLQDAIHIPALPVLRYSAPQAFATAGLLEEGGQQLELISLPTALEASQSASGELRISLSPSLVAAASDALAVLESSPYPSNEQSLSGFLPELEIYQAIQSFGVTAPELKARLESSLPDHLNAIVARQALLGGWSWWTGGESDPFISGYVLFGLARAQAAGISVPPEITQLGVAYLKNNMPSIETSSEGWQLDRLALDHFALAQAGAGDLSGAQALFEERARLSPWAQALLALTLDSLSAGSPQTQTLLSDLQSGALFSSSGAHWEDQNQGWQNMSSTASTTAQVAYALAQLEPASPTLVQAMRFLMASRLPDGAWASSYDTAWSLLAAAEFVKGTGELRGDFDFAATLNDLPLAAGQAGGEARLQPVTAAAPASSLSSVLLNALVIQRSTGTGRLYYTAVLDVSLPAETAAPLNRGMTVTRSYSLRGSDCTGSPCKSLQSIGTNQQVTVQLSLVIPQDAYYVLLEDYIPAGSELLDTSLKTSQLGNPNLIEGEMLEPSPQPGASFNAQDPFSEGWGWWYFHSPLIYDDHISWSADYLKAGTYVLEYVFTALQPGEFRVLPARARQLYFPDVQGSSAGMIFTISASAAP